MSRGVFVTFVDMNISLPAYALLDLDDLRPLDFIRTWSSIATLNPLWLGHYMQGENEHRVSKLHNCLHSLDPLELLHSLQL